MKPWLKNRSDKSACANIFLELPLTNSGIIFKWMQHHTIDHSLTSYTHDLYILYHLHLQLSHSRRNRFQKQPPSRCSGLHKLKISFTEMFHENLKKQFNKNLMLRYTVKSTISWNTLKEKFQCIHPLRFYLKKYSRGTQDNLWRG